MADLTDDARGAILLAAKLLTGAKRRRFQAEMANASRGSARLAETTFGWGREAVRTGLNDLRSGIRGVGHVESRGRPTTEPRHPVVGEHRRRLVDPHAPADPNFQPPFASTRVPARAVRQALLAIPEWEGAVPTRQTVGDILTRLGGNRRRVQKARPQKGCPRRAPSSPTSGRPVGSPPPTRTGWGSPSRPRRR